VLDLAKCLVYSISVSKKVTIHQAKTNLSKLIVSVEAGEEVIISRGGTPVARLSAVTKVKHKRILGRYQGKIKIEADFDDPLPTKIQKYFE
jgi:prevent-host-death family protein